MIMRRMNITGLLLLLTLIPFYIPDLSAQTAYERRRETLRGLKGVYVIVEELRRDDVKQAGLTQSILKTDIELKLRRAGIRILSIDEVLLTPGKPHLQVDANVIKLKLQLGFIYSIRVAFLQDAILSRNRFIKTDAITWQETLLGVNPNLRYVREVVSDLVDEFMNDYLAVNPK